MLLGDLLASFADESVAEEAILGLGDLTLISRMRGQAEADGMSLGAYAAGAVRRYAGEASDEEWVTLMGTLGRSADPGATCLRRAFAYVLSHP